MHRWAVASAAFVLGIREHLASDALPATLWINIHTAKLHAALAGWLKPKHARQATVVHGDPEPTVHLCVIFKDAIDLFRKGAFNVVFEFLFHLARCQEPVHADE